jgi:hypothetical protein
MSIVDYLLEKRQKRRYGSKAPSDAQVRRSFKDAQKALGALSAALETTGRDSGLVDRMMGQLRSLERDAGIGD